MRLSYLACSASFEGWHSTLPKLFTELASPPSTPFLVLLFLFEMGSHCLVRSTLAGLAFRDLSA